jgi:hypothetical protein
MRKVRALLLAVAMGAGSMLLSPFPARAATTGWVYLVTPRWWGWCPGSGNYVTWVDYANGNVSSGGDGGDDIVYAKVQLNTSNTITMAVQCRKNLPQGSQVTITPTRNNQTWFLGYPSGAWGN